MSASLASLTSSQPSERAGISDAVLNRLEGLTLQNGGYLEDLDVYAGELSDRESMQEAMLGRSPSVLVLVGDSQMESVSIAGKRSLASYDVEVFVISNHLRSRASTSYGDGAGEQTDPGAYRILEDIRDRLHGHKIQVGGSKQIRLQGEQIQISEREFAAWRATYKVVVEFCSAKTPADPKYQFESIETQSNLIVEANNK